MATAGWSASTGCSPIPSSPTATRPAGTCSSGPRGRPRDSRPQDGRRVTSWSSPTSLWPICRVPASSSWRATASRTRCSGTAAASSSSTYARTPAVWRWSTLTTGEVAHAWPFRQDELEAAAVARRRSTPMSWPSTTHSPRTSMQFGIVAIPERRPAGRYSKMSATAHPSWRRSGQNRPRRLSGLVQKRLQPPLAAVAERRHSPRAEHPGRRRVHNLRTARW